MKLKFLLILLISALFLGCKQKPQYIIGVSQCSYDDWRHKLNNEIDRELMVYGEAEAVIVSADDNPYKQIEDIRRFVADKVDLIMVSPVDSRLLVPAISEAMDAGIPVILFDRNISGDNYTAFIGADNARIGDAAAEYMASLLGGEGKVIEIEGLEASTPAVERRNGFDTRIDDFEGIEIVARAMGDWTPESSRRLTDSLLRLYPDTKGIFAHNDRMAIAAREAADSLGIKDIVIVGIDAVASVGIKAVADGVIDATFIYPTGGKELVQTAMQILGNKPYNDSIILTTVRPVDTTNAELLMMLTHTIDDETRTFEVLKDKIHQFTTRQSEQRFLLTSFFVIFILLGGFLFMILRAFWTHKRHREELAVQNDQLKTQRDELIRLNTQLNEATQAKLVFYTNVSHDLRTPLTLIAEPVAQLADAQNLTPSQHTLVKLADKNVRILMRLINQILDFRKYENGKLQLNLSEVNLEESLLEWSDSFRPLAQKRHLKYRLDINLPADFHMAVDTEKMERIFFNLMSNAFKFTPENGSVTAAVSLDGDDMVLRIEDSGKGMNAEEVEHIFERFYQAKKVRPGGSGIGLALVKSFVQLHNGDISVESIPDKGTVFTVRIPVTHTEQADEQPHASFERETVAEELAPLDDPFENQEFNPEKPTVLVIDDTSDIRVLLRSLLSDEYSVLEASNGKHGIKLATKYVPDLIICDVMMPGMGGMECCEAIKKEISTSHIPVLMLTACSLDEQRIESYECGADGYVAKPFSSKLLLARIKSLIENRRRINIKKDKNVPEPAVTSTFSVQPHPIPPNSDVENEFYTRFVEIVEKEIANPDISVEEIGSRLGLSRVQFYRKLKAITNYSPNELLRNIRLKKAYNMLVSTEENVSEIAYKVGYSSPSYFSKCFKEYFGELPADVQKRTSKI